MVESNAHQTESPPVRIQTRNVSAKPASPRTVVRYYGLTVSDGLKTWTVLTTVLGVAGFLLTYVAWILVGGLSV